VLRASCLSLTLCIASHAHEPLGCMLGKRARVMGASLKNSSLWPLVHTPRLPLPMLPRPDTAHQSACAFAEANINTNTRTMQRGHLR